MNLPRIAKVPFYKLMEYLVKSDFVRELFWKSYSDMISVPSVPAVTYVNDPYKRCIKKKSGYTPSDSRPIFITARFRAGSTFLWQIFRRITGVTAYYEPLNENRWFLPRHHTTDPSHIGVRDYDREYHGMEYLDQCFKDEWTTRRLLMTSRSCDDNLYRYISSLIKGAKDRRAVLQFNRMDFRLDWLRVHFPEAYIIHLYRHPREQWISMQRDGGHLPLSYRYKSDDMQGPFYLKCWAMDLRYRFPFLDPMGCHPYEIHYYIWRLSYMWGLSKADYHLAYEDLISDFKPQVSDIITFCGLNAPSACFDTLESLNKGRQETRWQSYAPCEWFEEIESRCEKNILRFFQES